MNMKKIIRAFWAAVFCAVILPTVALAAVTMKAASGMDAGE